MVSIHTKDVLTVVRELKSTKRKLERDFIQVSCGGNKRAGRRRRSKFASSLEQEAITRRIIPQMKMKIHIFVQIHKSPLCKRSWISNRISMSNMRQ